jgi:hypothetical protein
MRFALLVRELLQQRGLPDARFAAHERDTTATLGCGAEPFRQIGETSLTLKQLHRRRTRGKAGWRQL